MKTIKVLAGSLAALTAGATLAIGIFGAPITSLGDYVRVSGSTLNSPVIVVGSPATLNPGYPLDVIGAADIAAATAGYATTTVSAGSVGMSVAGGAEIGTTNTKLYLGDTLTKSGVKSTLTKADKGLETLLASGTLIDTSGTTYNYDQYLGLQNGNALTFGNSGGDLTDPDLLINLSYTPANTGIINYTVTFNKLLNVSSANVQNKKLNLLGVDYTIGATSAFDSTAKSLVLYGSSLVQTMAGGEEKTVTVGGTDYTVKVLGASGTTSAAVSVNGEAQTVTKGVSYTISGLPVYVEDVFYLSSTDQTQNSVKLSFGTNKLTLTDGQTVKKGTSDDTVEGTFVSLTGTLSSGISKIDISIAAKDINHDYIKQGADNAFVDPIFGSFKIAYGGTTGGATEKITVDNAGTTGASLKFTDYRGKEKTVNWAYTASGAFAPSMNATSTSTFVVAENGTVKQNDYVLLTPSQESEFSHIMQYTTSSGLGASGAYIELTDVGSGAVNRVYLNTGGYGSDTLYIDGQAYYANVTDVTNKYFKFTWGSSAGVNGVAGSKVTVFPLIKTSQGGWLTLAPGNRTATSVTLKAGVTILELPGGDVTIGNTTGAVNITCGSQSLVTLNAATATGGGYLACAPGRLAYNITVNNGTNAIRVVPLNGKAEYMEPVVIFREEKSKDTSNTDVQDFIVTTIGAGTGSTVNVAVQDINLTTQSDGYFSESLQSDNSVKQYVNRRGTVVKYDSDSQGMVEITYPDEQAVGTVAVGPSPTFGAGAAGTVQAAVKITSPVAKLASEVSATAPGADLILVGGPCANSLVAKLLAPAITCDNWNFTTGIIKEVTGGFTDGSRALIVAGNAATDTRALAAKVVAGTLSYQA